MPLPFKVNQEAAASAPIEKIKREPDQEADYDVLESAAEDLMHAIQSKDVKAIAVALRAAIELIEYQSQEQ